MPAKKLLLRMRHGLGDTIVMTALVRDIARSRPGQFEIAVETNFGGIWNNNPYLCPVSKAFQKEARRLAFRYDTGIGASKRGVQVHFLTWFYEDFRRTAGVAVPVTEPKGDLHLSADEQRPFVSGRYWVLLGGGKGDMPVKHWNYERNQQLVDVLRADGIRIVQAGALHSSTHHVHPPLSGVLDLVGQTEDVRDFLTLISQAEGVICPITSAMHIAACFDKPCVVIAGGREEPWWEAYINLPGQLNFGAASGKVKVPHRFLHTIGLLPCCMTNGCWRKRVVPLEKLHLHPTHKEGIRHNCLRPVRLPSGQAAAECMELISVDHVREAVLSYYQDGTLPPISPISTPEAPSTPAKRGFVHLPLFAQPDGPIDSQAPNCESSPTSGPLTPPTVPVEEPQLVRSPSVVRPRSEKSQTPYAEYGVKIQAKPTPVIGGQSLLDHPLIGGGITFFVLVHGQYPDLAKRCLESIRRTVPIDRCPIRVLANEACPETLDYLHTLNLDHLYVSPTNIAKYPAMRKAFFDAANPIKTNYVCWSDDDSHPVDVNWLDKACQAIITNHPKDYRLFGGRVFHDLRIYTKNGHRPEQWFYDADWYRKRPFRTRQAREASNGTCLFFATGSFWLLARDTIYEANIPDVRLFHRGGDVTIGEQCHQAGYDTFGLFRDKQTMIAWSDAPKRGLNHRFPWASPGSPIPK